MQCFFHFDWMFRAFSGFFRACFLLSLFHFVVFIARVLLLLLRACVCVFPWVGGVPGLGVWGLWGFRGFSALGVYGLSDRDKTSFATGRNACMRVVL